MSLEEHDYESIPHVSPWVQMVGGAIAGVMEHCLVYPIDSVKTRMQMLNGTCHSTSGGVIDTLWRMVRHEGVLRPVRGMSAVVVGAGPAHAAYFTAYENLRDAVNSWHVLPQAMAPAVAGVAATLIHDALMTPADAVKQRMQMFNSPFSSCWQCARTIYARDGIGVFYRAYLAQLAMNLPFQCIHFVCYEQMQRLVNPERQYWPMAHMLCGAVSGATAAAVTTPIDVCKTLLNTQEASSGGGRRVVVGLTAATYHVYTHDGLAGFMRGLRARVVYQIPSTAICWTVYESMKYFLSPVRSDPPHSGDRRSFDAVVQNSGSVGDGGVCCRSYIGGDVMRLYSGVVHTAEAQPAASHAQQSAINKRP